MNEFNVGNVKVIEITKGMYNGYFNGTLYYEDLHSKSIPRNDEDKLIIKEIKELEKKEKIVRLSNAPVYLTSIKVPYPSRIHQELVAKLQELKLSQGLNISSFINEAIAEKLEKEGLL